MTREEIEARIDLLGDEIDANEEENRMMQDEIDDLYDMLGKMKALETDVCQHEWKKVAISMAESKYECKKCGEECWR